MLLPWGLIQSAGQHQAGAQPGASPEETAEGLLGAGGLLRPLCALSSGGERVGATVLAEPPLASALPVMGEVRQGPCVPGPWCHRLPGRGWGALRTPSSLASPLL